MAGRVQPRRGPGLVLRLRALVASGRVPLRPPTGTHELHAGADGAVPLPLARRAHHPWLPHLPARRRASGLGGGHGRARRPVGSRRLGLRRRGAVVGQPRLPVRAGQLPWFDRLRQVVHQRREQGVGGSDARRRGRRPSVRGRPGLGRSATGQHLRGLLWRLRRTGWRQRRPGSLLLRGRHRRAVQPEDPDRVHSPLLGSRDRGVPPAGRQPRDRGGVLVVSLPALEGTRYPDPAADRPGCQRPPRQAGRSRADRRRAHRGGNRARVPAVCRRGPWLRQAGEPVALLRRRRALLGPLPRWRGGGLANRVIDDRPLRTVSLRPSGVLTAGPGAGSQHNASGPSGPLLQSWSEASTSSSIFTLLLTTTLPSMREWLKLTPKSRRSISAAAEKAMSSFPSCIEGPVPRYSRSKTTGLVTPRSVRSVASFHSPSLTLVSPVLETVTVGKFGASRKSLVRRWSSRIPTPVLMLAAWASACSVEFSIGSATVKVPSNSENWPRTLVPTRWRATKPTTVWALSMAYVPVLGAVMVSGLMGASPLTLGRLLMGLYLRNQLLVNQILWTKRSARIRA